MKAASARALLFYRPRRPCRPCRYGKTRKPP